MDPSSPLTTGQSSDHFVIIVWGLVTVVTGILGLAGLLIRNYNKTKTVVEQVKNNHTSNMREESDDRHDNVTGKLDRIDRRLVNQSESISNLYDLIVVSRREIELITDTLTPEQRITLQKEKDNDKHHSHT